MSDTSHLKCPRCGKELPPSAPEGLCPACLGALNFATETNVTGADTKEALPPMTPAELAPHFPQLEILDCLGRGGMGVVYKAKQKSLNRLVALKLLAPERVQDPKFAERFAKEAQALALLNHPNIVTIHDFGQAGGFYFLLMEFVDGVNLRQLLHSRKLQPTEALAIVPPVCEALQFAHEHGIVHRDIKPENLLLAKDGRVKIADFGIAKIMGSEASAASISLASSGGEGQGEEAPGSSATQQTTMGTPQYMAPEQREQPQIADHRADIYSLGVVLYELLTGELPASQLQPPSRKVQIDVRLDEIVLRALEKTPELRYQTAGEFKTQVETVGSKGNVEDHTAHVDTMPAKSGPLPRELKVIAWWMMVQGGLALANSIFAFISWGQIFLNLLIIHLIIGFGLMNFRAGWWRAAIAMNGVQLFASLVGVPLYLFAGASAGNMLSPWEAFRGQPVVLGAMVLIQCVLVITCSLVHFTLMRLRREGWFGPVTRKHGTAGFPVMVVVFYAGVILGICFIGMLSFRFSRDSAYLLLLGIMAVVSPFVGVMTGNALRQAEQAKDQSSLERIKGRLKALSIVAWILALPVVGFAVFFFLAMLSERGGWNPAVSEAVVVPLTWLGACLLPWAALRLRRTSQEQAGDFPARRTSGSAIFLWVVGLVTVVMLLLGCALLITNARHVKHAQVVATREAAERKQEESRRWATTVHQLAGPPYIAQLPYGGNVELLAVRLHPGNTNQAWWRPDGSPSPYGPDITIERASDLSGGVLGLAKIKWPKAPEGKETSGFSMDGGRFALKNGLRVPYEEYSVIHFENVVARGDEATLSLSVGVREWETLVTMKPGRAKVKEWEFSTTANSNLKLTAKQLTQQPGAEYRLVAVDTAGKLHTPNSFRTTTATGSLASEYEAVFDGVAGSRNGLRPDAVKEVYWQQRPLDSIAFSGVSLKPGHSTRVAVREFPEVVPATSSPAALTASRDTEVTTKVPTQFLFSFGPVVLMAVLAASLVGGAVLLVWVSRKHGAKGCVLAGAIILFLGFLVVIGVGLMYFASYRAPREPTTAAKITLSKTQGEAQTVARITAWEAEPKSIVFLSVTNHSGAINLMSSTPHLPGEVIQPVIRFEDGSVEAGSFASFSTKRTEGADYNAISLTWQPFPALAPELELAALTQIRERWASNNLVLTPGQATRVFTVINAKGMHVYGEVDFKRVTHREDGAKLSFHKATGFPGFVSALFYSSVVPEGCQLVARGQFPKSLKGEAHSHLTWSRFGSNGGLTWFLREGGRNVGGRTADSEGQNEISQLTNEAARQMNQLMSRGPLEVRLGQPIQAFSVTNSAGEVFSGSIELVGNKP